MRPAGSLQCGWDRHPVRAPGPVPRGGHAEGSVRGCRGESVTVQSGFCRLVWLRGTATFFCHGLRGPRTQVAGMLSWCLDRNHDKDVSMGSLTPMRLGVALWPGWAARQTPGTPRTGHQLGPSL